jgi:hypothetical protein
MGWSLDSSLDHIVLVNNAKRALERGRFELTYQPIYSVDQREVDSVETLLRWRLGPDRRPRCARLRAGGRRGMISGGSASMPPPSTSVPGILPCASPTWCRISA